MSEKVSSEANQEAAEADVEAAATIDRALALIETQTFDLAMLDVNLDGKPSYPIADALTRRDVPFLFSTGYGDRSLHSDYSHQAVLNKPYTDHAMSAALAALLPTGHEVAA